MRLSPRRLLSTTLATSLASLLLTALPLATQAQLRYDDEYPTIGYSTAQSSDAVTRLLQEVAAGERQLAWREGRGYLDALLEALDIDPASQTLVFSKTSLKNRFISAATPRALYFNDSVYVGFAQGSRSLEVAAMDAALGPVFFSIPNMEGEAPQDGAERELGRCLRCHDSYGLSGGGVPRFLLSSNLAGPDGTIVSHEFSAITSTATPLERRWGGFFVSGTHGEQQHLGNVVVHDTAMLRQLDLSQSGNQTDLSAFTDLSPYPVASSDIVALLVLEHQVEVQNLITRVNFDLRTLLDRAAPGEDTQPQVAASVEQLLEALFMSHEAPFSGPIAGTSGYAERFQALGPQDAEGRSLRQLDLETRTFRYPLSYLVYSEAFLALPEVARHSLYQRIDEVLTGRDDSEVFAHLEPRQRDVIRDILLATHAEFAAFVNGEGG